MKKKILNLLLLVAFQFGYLEWGKDNNMFIFQAEKEIFSKAITDWRGIIHPFIIIPFIGILLLTITLFQKTPGRALTVSGLAALAILMLFILFIGILSLNYKITLSAIPFHVIAILILFSKKVYVKASANNKQ